MSGGTDDDGDEGEGVGAHDHPFSTKDVTETTDEEEANATAECPCCCYPANVWGGTDVCVDEEEGVGRENPAEVCADTGETCCLGMLDRWKEDGLTYQDCADELRSAKVSCWEFVDLTTNGFCVDEINCAIDVDSFDGVDVVDVLDFGIHGLFSVCHDERW